MVATASSTTCMTALGRSSTGTRSSAARRAEATRTRASATGGATAPGTDAHALPAAFTLLLRLNAAAAEALECAAASRLTGRLRSRAAPRLLKATATRGAPGRSSARLGSRTLNTSRSTLSWSSSLRRKPPESAPRFHAGAPASSSEPLGRRCVVVGYASAVTRVVLPGLHAAVHPGSTDSINKDRLVHVDKD